MDCLICPKKNIRVGVPCSLFKDQVICIPCCFAISAGGVEMSNQLRDNFKLNKREFLWECTRCLTEGRVFNKLSIQKPATNPKKEIEEPTAHKRELVGPLDVDKKIAGEPVNLEKEVSKPLAFDKDVKNVTGDLFNFKRELTNPQAFDEEIAGEPIVPEREVKEPVIVAVTERLVINYHLLKDIVTGASSEEKLYEELGKFLSEYIGKTETRGYEKVKKILLEARSLIEQKDLKNIFIKIKKAIDECKLNDL
ncbi:MAG: hypothetical protein V1872_14330 [bacterium]